MANGLTAAREVVGYAGGSPANPAPKEIGLLQRTEGVRNGLDEIFERLNCLADRIGGSDHPRGSGATPVLPVGLPGNLSAAEGRIRETLEVIGLLEKAF